MRRHAKALFAVTAMSMLLCASPALAAKTTTSTVGAPTASSLGSFFSTPSGVAVNQTGSGGVPAGTFYVADRTNNRIQRFGPAGAFVSAFGWDTVVNGSLSDPGGVTTFQTCTVPGDCKAGTTGTGAGQFGSAGIQAIAVDKATGNVYVSDQANRRISAFRAEGAFAGAFGWGALDGTAALQFCTTATGCNAPGATAPASGDVGGGQFGAMIGGLALDASGDLYVADKTSRRVAVFKPLLSGPAKVVTGVEFLRAFGWGAATGAAAFEVCAASPCKAPAAAGTSPGQFGANSPQDVALDASGNLYALDAANKRVQKFDSTPAPLEAAFGAAAITAAFGTGNLYNLSYETAANRLYVSGSSSTASNRVRVAELDGAGALLDTHATDLTVTSATGLAATPESLGGSLYLTTAVNNTLHGAYVLNDAKPAIDPVTAFTATTATFSGSVVSREVAGAYRFEYSADGSTWAKAPATDAAFAAAPGSIPVSQNATGLSPATEYQVRLIATRPAGGPSATSATTSFTTPSAAPSIASTGAAGIGSTDATLEAKVNPNGLPSTYRFEYGAADCSSNPCASIPVPDGQIAAGNAPVALSRQLSGLQPGTTYHFRALAENSGGPVASADKTFKTYAPVGGEPGQIPGQGFLPHNRAWELVSPPDKNGGEVSALSQRTRAAADGSAIQFLSLQGFDDTIGSGVGFEYMAQRSTGPEPGHSGWTTHAITPPQASQTFISNILSTEPKYEGEFSDDLTRGVFFALSPVQTTPFTDQSNVAEAFNLYRRTDLRTPGAGAYQLLSDCPRCAAEGTPLPPITATSGKPSLAGASAGFGHVIFESATRWTSDAPVNANIKLYESEDGSVRLAGVLPDGSAAERSIAGRGVSIGQAPRNVSRPISADGSRIFFTFASDNSEAGIPGPIYARINGRASIQLNASERAVPDSAQSATYWNASADGSRVFFTSRESLTEDAPPSSQKLYMWKQADHDEEQSVAVDAGGGAFTLAFNGATTTPIASNAPAAAVQSALEGLVTVKPGNVSVSGGPGSPGAPAPYKVSFTGDFAGANVAQMTADGSGLTGGAATAAVSTTAPVKNLAFLNVDGNPEDGPAGEVRGVIGASEDGRYAYFAAEGQLVAGKPKLGSDVGIYLWHDGAISYVGKSPSFGENASGMLDGVNVALRTKQSFVTPDGRGLLFNAVSGEGLLSAHGGVDYDHGKCVLTVTCSEFYVYSADTDTLQCASCNPTGAPATTAAFDAQREGGAAAQVGANSNPRPLSADGRFAFFSTAEKLVGEDINGAVDAYAYDTTTGKPHLLSSGESPYPSYFLEASADGRDVFFVTRERLSGWDVDTGYDLYDARVDGGFPEPPPPPPSCQGDACQPAPLGLDDPTPSSSSAQGPGNQAQNRSLRCRKGQRRVKARNGKARCVKRTAKPKQSKRDANSNRRAGR